MGQKNLPVFWDGNRLIYVDRTHNRVIKQLPLWLRIICFLKIERVGLVDEYKREMEDNLNIQTNYRLDI